MLTVAANLKIVISSKVVISFIKYRTYCVLGYQPPWPPSKTPPLPVFLGNPPTISAFCELPLLKVGFFREHPKYF